jgi:hypothetical protein
MKSFRYGVQFDLPAVHGSHVLQCEDQDDHVFMLTVSRTPSTTDAMQSMSRQLDSAIRDMTLGARCLSHGRRAWVGINTELDRVTISLSWKRATYASFLGVAISCSKLSCLRRLYEGVQEDERMNMSSYNEDEDRCAISS